MNTIDTIVAPASGIGGAVTVIRISGREALACGNAVWRGRAPLGPENVRRMMLGRIGGEPTLAVYMCAPHSYTGEDVVELHCHGGAAAADRALKLALENGCRLAEPGEFTYRAFVSGKLDLLQAEAVADLVNSGSAAARELAERQLGGALSSRINQLLESVDYLRSECEARLDFPDEELEFDPEVPEKIADARNRIAELLDTAGIGASLRDGIDVVLAGRPNAGKSSLLNYLVGRERAIVSPVPGTTRDVIEVNSVLAELPVRLIDTAGIRDTGDEIEKLGVERSHGAIRRAGVVFWVLDAAADPAAEVAEMRSVLSRHPGVTAIAVWNKCDLPAAAAPRPETTLPTAAVSARTGENIDELIRRFAAAVRTSAAERMPEVAVNARSAALLQTASEELASAAAEFASEAWELAASRLARASDQLGEIVGRTVSPDLLDAVFHRFCLGK